MSGNFANSYTSVTWTTGDIITEVKLDAMVLNDQSHNAFAAEGILLNNTVEIKGKNTTGTNKNLLYVDSSNILQVGDATLSGINLNGTITGPWWEELGRTTLGSAGDTITVSSFAARRYLKIITTVFDTGGAISGLLRFNNDSGNNYSRRYSVNGSGTDTTQVSQSSILAHSVSAANPQRAEIDVYNVAADEKVCTILATGASTAGAGTAPSRIDGGGKWSNTTDQITRVDYINDGAGDFAIGSEVVVLGHN